MCGVCARIFPTTRGIAHMQWPAKLKDPSLNKFKRSQESVEKLSDNCSRNFFFIFFTSSLTQQPIDAIWQIEIERAQFALLKLLASMCAHVTQNQVVHNSIVSDVTVLQIFDFLRDVCFCRTHIFHPMQVGCAARDVKFLTTWHSVGRMNLWIFADGSGY